MSVLPECMEMDFKFSLYENNGRIHIGGVAKNIWTGERSSLPDFCSVVGEGRLICIPDLDEVSMEMYVEELPLYWCLECKSSFDNWLTDLRLKSEKQIAVRELATKFYREACVEQSRV
ncbi:MAG: hypothetical protein K6L73_14780 [Cellvibrionaceae bacterium]